MKIAVDPKIALVPFLILTAVLEKFFSFNNQLTRFYTLCGARFHTGAVMDAVICPAMEALAAAPREELKCRCMPI